MSVNLSIEMDVKGMSDRISNHYHSRVQKGMKKALAILLEELKRLTPEDTKEMLNSYKVNDIVVIGDTVIGSIGNTADHAIYVEFGVAGRTYTYHKPKGSPVYSGIGNRTFARAMDNKKKEMLSAINKALG